MITRATAMPWRSAAAGHGLQQRRRALAFRGAAPSLPPPPPPLSPSLASAAAVACAAYSEPLRVLREVGQVDGVRLEEGKRVE